MEPLYQKHNTGQKMLKAHLTQLNLCVSMSRYSFFLSLAAITPELCDKMYKLCQLVSLFLT